jgi:hypothetical protein
MMMISTAKVRRSYPAAHFVSVAWWALWFPSYAVCGLSLPLSVTDNDA